MYDQFDLLDFLNYDSNTKSFLSIEERMMLHRKISRKINGRSIRAFPSELEMKLDLVKSEMKRTKWKPIILRYNQDRELFKLINRIK